MLEKDQRLQEAPDPTLHVFSNIMTTPRQPTALDDYLFDLRGFLILENAVAPELLATLNTAFDNFPTLKVGEWWGNAHRRDYTDATGFELQNCVEAGEPFEQLIDHP